MDLDNRVVIDLQVEAALPLICQASLEVYDEVVNRRTELAVIEDDKEQTELPDNYEPVRVENGRLAIARLVEDELLLAMPQIPRNPGLEKIEYSTDGRNYESVNQQDTREKNPFIALQDMLKRNL